MYTKPFFIPTPTAYNIIPRSNTGMFFSVTGGTRIRITFCRVIWKSAAARVRMSGANATVTVDTECPSRDVTAHGDDVSLVNSDKIKYCFFSRLKDSHLRLAWLKMVFLFLIYIGLLMSKKKLFKN